MEYQKNNKKQQPIRLPYAWQSFVPFLGWLSDPFKGQVTSKFWMKRSRLESPVSSHFFWGKTKAHTHTPPISHKFRLKSPSSRRLVKQVRVQRSPSHTTRSSWQISSKCCKRQKSLPKKTRRPNNEKAEKTTPSYPGMKAIYTCLFMVITIVVTYNSILITDFLTHQVFWVIHGNLVLCSNRGVF